MNTSSNENKKVIIIGLDGANKTTGKLLRIDEKYLHTFLSAFPPYTPPSWTSILTGVKPNKHGIIGWQKIDRNTSTKTIVTSYDVKYPRISELLSMKGFKSVLINLPMSYPFGGISGKENMIIVSDWAALKQEIYPHHLMEKYSEVMIDPPHYWWRHENKGKEEYIRLVSEYLSTRLSLYYDLLEKYEWDFYFIVFSEIDWLSHAFPELLKGRYNSGVKTIFREIRRFIEEAKLYSDIMFIVSDHGFEIKKEIFYVNEALKENGFIKYSFARHVRDVASKTVSKAFSKFMLQKIVKHKKIKNKKESSIFQNEIAIMIEAPTWGVYLKTPQLVDRVKSALEEYPQISKILTREEVYGSISPDIFPNVFLVPRAGVEFSASFSGKIYEKTYRGDHEPHGIFAVFGEGVGDGILFNQIPTVYDIAPTVLHIFELPIPDNIDGRVLLEIFKENSKEHIKTPKYVSIDYYTQREKLQKVVKNLRLKRKI